MKLILNPNAGQGKGMIFKPVIKKLLNLNEDDIIVTKNINEIKEYAKKFANEGCKTIVVACGDGGFNYLINGILEKGKDCLLYTSPSPRD